MRFNFKKTQTNLWKKTKQNSFNERSFVNLTLKDKDKTIEKTTKGLRFINFFLFQLGIINFLILTYFYMQEDIIFQATGWFRTSENIHWYYIFLGLIVVRMLIFLVISYLTYYINNVSLWTEKKKKNALYVLAAINLLTLPINLPLIGGFYAYMKGSEILSKNVFLGTFRRILSENERTKLYQETVQNFLDKIEVSKQIKDQLKNWAFDNKKSILPKYDDGSVFATEYISEQLKMKKEFFQLKEIKSEVEALAAKTTKDEQVLSSSIFEKTLHALNYLNPFVTDFKTCAISWCVVVFAGVLIGTVVSNSISINELKSTRENLQNQVTSHQKSITALRGRLKVQENTLNTNNEVLKGAVDKIDGHHDVLQAIVDTSNQRIETNTVINTRIDTLEIKFTKIKDLVNSMFKTIPKTKALTTEEKNKLLTDIAKKYQNAPLNKATFIEMLKDVLTNS